MVDSSTTCITKRCNKCGDDKPIELFAKAKKRKDGHASVCKDCHYEFYVKPHRAANREKYNASVRAYNRRNRDKINARERAKPGRTRAHREKTDPDYAKKHSAITQAWRAKNREHIKEVNKAYAKKVKETPEIQKETKRLRKLWREANRDKMVATDQRRRSRKKSAGHFTAKEWSDLKKQHDYKCLCCGRQEPAITLTVDHVKALSDGGSNTFANLQPLCGPCNFRKNAKHMDFRVPENDLSSVAAEFKQEQLAHWANESNSQNDQRSDEGFNSPKCEGLTDTTGNNQTDSNQLGVAARTFSPI